MNNLVELSSNAKVNDKDVIAACLSQDIAALERYKEQGVNFNNVYNSLGDTLLHLAIQYNKPKTFDTLIGFGVNIENPSRHDGTTALNYAAMEGSSYYVNKLITLGADVNSRAEDGFTPLNNALYFEEYSIAKSLLSVPTTDVNTPSNGKLPPAYWAYLDKHFDLVDKIIAHPTFDATYHQVILNNFDSQVIYKLKEYLTSHGPEVDEYLLDAFQQAKVFGLKFDLSGCLPLTQLDSHQLECLSFSGYANPLAVSAMTDAYSLFYNNIVSDSTLPSWAMQTFTDVNASFAFSADNIFNANAFYNQIALGEVVIIPSGWSGHSITFVVHDNMLYRCNRGGMSDGIHGIEEFTMNKPWNLTESIINTMLKSQGTSQYLQNDIIDILGLQKIGEIENPQQITGNCTWTSLEAALEASFLTNFLTQGVDSQTAHQLAKDSFLIWEEFDLTTTLNHIIEEPDLFIQQEIYDDLLIKSLDNHHDPMNEADIQKAIAALGELDNPLVFDTFDKQIGQTLIKYDPNIYESISYMKPYAPSYYDYFTSFFSSSNSTLSKAEQQKAKEYVDFLKACDDYQQKNGSSPVKLQEILDFSFTNALEDLFGSSVVDVALALPNSTSVLDTPILVQMMPTLDVMMEQTAVI